MCITLPSSPRADRRPNPSNRLWAWLIDSPLRLLSGGGLVALGLSALSWFWLPEAAGAWYWFNLQYGVAAFWLFGLLLRWYPRWLHVTPVRYARFGLIFFLLLAAQLLCCAGIGWFGRPGLFCLVTLLIAWSLTLATLRGMQILAPREPLRVRWLQILLQLAAVGMLLHASGMLFGQQELVLYTRWFGVALLLLSMLLILAGGARRIGTPHTLR